MQLYLREIDNGVQAAPPSPPEPEPPIDEEKESSQADIEWVEIKGGRFKMGSNEEDDEKPPHWVTVPSFEMLETEVTVDQYKACRECSKPRDKSDNKYYNWGYGDRGDHPVNCVDWEQASAFCRSLGGRLPTEAEWEHAARSGGKDRKYPWGDQPVTCDYAIWGDGSNTDGCGKDSTWPVCSKTRGNTDQGLCDMAGNVWEWVEDKWHDNYNGAPADGNAWTGGSDERRVLRGGSWGNGYETNLRASYRDWSGPADRYDDNGFRCMRSSR